MHSSRRRRIQWLASKDSLASSKACWACSRLTVGNPSRKRSKLCPASRYSKSVRTRTRVPRNVGAPDIMSELRTTTDSMSSLCLNCPPQWRRRARWRQRLRNDSPPADFLPIPPVQEKLLREGESNHIQELAQTVDLVCKRYALTGSN